jgi:hypothetical protein
MRGGLQVRRMVCSPGRLAKWTLFLSAVPITITMNSMRIGVVGLAMLAAGITGTQAAPAHKPEPPKRSGSLIVGDSAGFVSALRNA